MGSNKSSLPAGKGAGPEWSAYESWNLAIEAGAVYRPPAVMVPVLGLSDQVTAVLEVPVTVGVNC